MSNNTRNSASALADKLHICLVKAINIALTERAGEDWFEKFRDYDSNQDIPILDKSQISVKRMDLQACLKFFRYRGDYSKIVFEYFGHNFYVDTDDARKAQLLLNQRLDNLIHNARNYLFAHAGASMVEAGKDDSIRYSVYGASEAVNDMLKLASFFSAVTDDEGKSYYIQMQKMSEPSKSYSISETISSEGMDISVGAFAEVCNKLGIKVATSKDGAMSFESGNYGGDIAKIKLYISENFKNESRYNIAETINKENIRTSVGNFVVACQNLNISVSTDESGELEFSTSNYSGDVARIKLVFNNKQTKKSKKILIIAILAVVLAAGAVALVLSLANSGSSPSEDDKPAVLPTVSVTEQQTTVATKPQIIVPAGSVEEKIKRLSDNLRIACENNSFEDFSKYFIDIDEDVLRAEYNGWCDLFMNYDQNMALKVCEVDEDAYVANFLFAIVTGTHPNTNSSLRGVNYLVVNTPDGLKLSFNEELVAKTNGYIMKIAPEEYKVAADAGQNATAFDTHNWMYLDSSVCMKGSIDAWCKYLWQDKNGDVYINMTINNGTDINRTVYNFRITIEDETLGTVCNVTLDESCKVKKLSNRELTLKIPASEILTGKETWTSMSYSIDSSNR